ncbi:MAG: hypothetical protein EOL95_10575 [Bacteroidia bacterium]|nr:hypothetical protein [Bacteroidia bacterium]
MKEIQKELLKVLFSGFMAIIVFIALDLSLGTMAKKLFFIQETGKYARITHSIEDADAEVIIMGNSHANRHYNPEILKDSLDITCYNCGVQGQGIIFQEAMLSLIYNNYSPKIILLNIEEKWFYASQSSYDRLADLNPYYLKYRATLKPIFSRDSSFREFPLYLKSYQMNSTLIHTLRYIIAPQPDIYGYVPLYGKLKAPENFRNKKATRINQNIQQKIDMNCYKALDSFCKTAALHDTKVIFIISPGIYLQNQFETLPLYNQLAIKHNIPVWNFSSNREFLYHYDLFNDNHHLNNDGAELFTSLLVQKIKEMHPFPQ